MYIYQLLTSNGRIDRYGLLNVVAFIVALFVALILHEIAHGLVALWNGDNTAKAYGRLSLNPIKHFDWMGLLLMLIVGFGWAKPVPVNPNNFRNRKVGAITVSIAGVVTNITIAFFAAMGWVLLSKVNVYGMKDGLYYFVYFCAQLMNMLLALNVSFALFNILPLYPLDGYRLLSCFVSQDNGFMRFLRKYSYYIVLGFVALNLLSAYIPVIPNLSPLYWYVSGLGGLIRNGFEQFWRLIF
ncbi:MAG: site-2 protease family protein [Clostridiales bacterium]|nr:site-2 protease family protein [Clostridiales bacterium]